jgi:homocysteine S-methyltransferase
LATLKDFHRRRVQVLADSGADLLAFETIPNKIEAQVS